MAFKVFRNGQEPAEEFGDKDRLEIIEGGVLKIRRQDGTNRYINPACWVSINETPPSTSSPQIDPSRDDLDDGGDIMNRPL
jgi:hypothetical protein